MSEEKRMDDVTGGSSTSSTPASLREMIRRTREFFDRTITTARVHSPFAEDKLEAADNAVADVIHKGYQGVKRIAVNGHPAVIITFAGIAGAVPSIPFGPRALIRNAGLAAALAAVMIYPDHLNAYMPKSSSPGPAKSE